MSEQLQENLHHAEAAELAARRGWRHHAHPEQELDQRWPGAPFGIGAMAALHNLIEGDVEGFTVTAFDYRFIVDHDDAVDQFERKAHRQYLVCVVEIGAVTPPLCAIEGSWPHWSPPGERRTVDHERFGEHYAVHCVDEEFPGKVLDAETMDRLLHRMRATEWRLHDGLLVVWAKGQHVHSDLESLLEAVIPLAERARAAAAAVA